MKRATLLLTTLLAGISMSAATLAGGDKSFSDIDQDGDQNVSQYELEEAGMEDVNMDELDEDNDGVLGEEEFQQAKDQMKDKDKQKDQQDQQQ